MISLGEVTLADFDAIIVGSGMSGGWSAKELAERGLKVLVLERGPEMTPEKNYSDHIPGITSFDKKHLIKHGVKNKHITTENVSSINILELIKKHSFNSFQLLYVDAEGYDGDIVIDFLLSTLIRPLIILEYIHIANNTFRNLLDLLEKNNYVFFTINENLICYPSNYKELIEFN